jgi:hypothetical protein
MPRLHRRPRFPSRLAVVVCALCAGAMESNAPGRAAGLAGADGGQTGRAAAPLVRHFTAGEIRNFRIQFTVQIHAIGVHAETIGAKTYVRPFTRDAAQVSRWRETRRVESVAADGAASITETMSDFAAVPGTPTTASGNSATSNAGDADSGKMSVALRAALKRWGRLLPRTIRYRELADGELRGLDAQGSPPLEEAAPPVLTLWLLRALRPEAALPGKPLRFDDKWDEPREVALPNWSDVRANESGEWLPATNSDAEPAVRLLKIQQISANVTAGPEKPPEGTAAATFHAESLDTVSLQDGELMEGTRSAVREVSWTLAPVSGLRRPPAFKVRLSVQVEIRECPGNCDEN